MVALLILLFNLVNSEINLKQTTDDSPVDIGESLYTIKLLAETLLAHPLITTVFSLFLASIAFSIIYKMYNHWLSSSQVVLLVRSPLLIGKEVKAFIETKKAIDT
jgi:hypothetical protein